MFIELFPSHNGWIDTIETERIILRKSEEKRDLSSYHNHLKNDGDFEMFSGLPLTDDNVKKFGMSLSGSYYSIFEKITNNMIGYVAITFHELWQEEIEFYIYKDFRRKGYAYEACSALLKYYFTVSEESTISSTTRSDNIATKGLLTKLGFAYIRNEGVVVGKNIGMADDIPVELYTKFEASAIKINIPEILDESINDMENSRVTLHEDTMKI